MARASGRTSVFEIQSATSGESLFVTERALFRVEKVGRHQFVRTDLRPVAHDANGRRFERMDGMRFRCVASGEAFHIIEQAPSIRKISA